MKSILNLGVFLLTLGFSQAQTEYRSKASYPFLFYNYQSGKYTVIDDSTGCHEYNMHTGSWDFKPLTFQLEEPFHRFLETYNLLHDKGSDIFFVDKGCGMVYILQNDTIKRHDRSKHHDNQYNGTFFLYNGEPHIFGGYGLFQFKNIITRYDVKDREWYCYDVKGKSFPEPRYASFGKVEGDKLFILGGVVGKTKATKRDQDVWCFDFSSLSWKKTGKYNNYNNEDILLTPNSFSIHGAPIIVQYDFFSEPYFSKNRQCIYELKQHGKIHGLLPVGSTCLTHKIEAKSHCALVSVMNRSEVFDKVLFNGTVILPVEEENSWGSIGWIVATFLVLLLIANYYLFFRPKKSGNGRLVLNTNEQQLLDVFLATGEEGIEISMVNDIVNHDAPSADTLKKRRENLLKELRQKLAGTFRLSSDEVFIEEKHPTDKRIKILKLHHKIADKLTDSNRGK